MTEVVGSDEFTEWFDSLDDSDTDAVARVVDMLEMQGPTLPFPYSSAIKGSKIALRELRIQAGGDPLRVLYAFDPVRRAVLLLGGDKTGDKRFYERLIPLAEQIFAQYLKEIGR
ncbi:MAG: type II toxin-antitoxin system RelE/ParE family toxin [Polyangiaceae bacterium]